MIRVMASQQLFAWIGKTDLRASEGESVVGLGPIGQVVEKRVFESIHLLSNYPAAESEKYVSWLDERYGVSAVLHLHELSSPVDYGEIYEAAVRTVDDVSAPEDARRSFHTSPGTPAMAAVWILLAQTIRPAELLQSSVEQGVVSLSLPFELSLDYLPGPTVIPESDLEQLAQALPPANAEFGDIVHRSDVMRQVIIQARRFAAFEVPVLILGESGTGKELFARAIHRQGARSEGPFVAVNCGAIPESLVESELFGHKKGAFTGADKDRVGHIENADGGILFLDEIGELPPQTQVKLLRVLNDGKFQPVGGTRAKEVNFRVVAATNRPLLTEVASGNFREDLFFRLSTTVLQLPPLRQRSGDVTLLVDRFLENANQKFGDSPGWIPKHMSAAARNLLNRHDWPGNVRELENTILRIAILTPGKKIEKSHVEQALLPVRNAGQDDGILSRELGEEFDLQQVASEVWVHYIERAMKLTAGNKAAAARLVGAPSAQTFSNWVKQHNLK